MHYMLIYPAVGKSKLGPVEILSVVELDEIAYEQAKLEFVKIIRMRPVSCEEHYYILCDQLSYDQPNDEFDWIPVKEMSP